MEERVLGESVPLVEVPVSRSSSLSQGHGGADRAGNDGRVADAQSVGMRGRSNSGGITLQCLAWAMCCVARPRCACMCAAHACTPVWGLIHSERDPAPQKLGRLWPSGQWRAPARRRARAQARCVHSQPDRGTGTPGHDGGRTWLRGDNAVHPHCPQLPPSLCPQLPPSLCCIG